MKNALCIGLMQHKCIANLQWGNKVLRKMMAVFTIHFHLNNLQYLIHINHYSTLYCYEYSFGAFYRRLMQKCSLITNKQYIILKYGIFHLYTSLIRFPGVWRRYMHEGFHNWFLYPNGTRISPSRPQNSRIHYEVFEMLGPITENLKAAYFHEELFIVYRLAWLQP